MATPSPSPSDLWITGEQNGFPRPFGNYLLLAAFAQGGMGELFLAMNGSIAGAFRLCVVKKLRPDLTNDREYVNRFIDEARVVVQLNHANISHVFDIGRIEGQYYLAMEYVSGVSLKRLMSRALELGTEIPEDIAIFAARAVLEALDYAHRHTHPLTGEALHVVHRDVSPQNVLVSWAGEIKLIDFGLALSAMKDEHTATGAVMGKVAYMPPEQARGDEVGASCDQFASAIITYEMIANERYHGDLPLHAIWAIAGMGNFPPPKWNKLNKELQTILGKALHNDPAKRYETCGDLREALRGYLSTHYPATSERNVRELLDVWFKEYRTLERELLLQFKDVTGAKIREAVKGTEAEAESLLSGPHQRPAFLQQPPLPPPRAPTPAPILTPLLDTKAADESRSMRLMPPPMQHTERSLGDVAVVAQALLSPLPASIPPPTTALTPAVVPPRALTPEPLPALSPILAPPVGARTNSAPNLNLQTVAESTAAFIRSAPGQGAVGSQLQVLVPLAAAPNAPAVAVGEPTERYMRDRGLTALPTSSPAPGNGAAPVLVPVHDKPPPPPPAPVRTAAKGPPMDPREPTMRLARRAATPEEEDAAELAAFAESRKIKVSPIAAVVAAIAITAVITAIAVTSSSHGAAPDTPIAVLPTPVTPVPPAPPVPPGPGTAVDPNVAPNVDPTHPAHASAPTTPSGSVHASHASHSNSGGGGTNAGATHGKTADVIPAGTTTTPAATPDSTDGMGSKEAMRARDRVDTLRRSQCKDPCVGRIVGQLETMPGAV
ncbi:MAG TPA: serine/threonine-protein kinase, partial [Myxococcota bacterium]